MTKLTDTCTVDESGCIYPLFVIEDIYTSGFLKYFTTLAGRDIRITIELLEPTHAD